MDAHTSPCGSEDATPGSHAGVHVLALPGRVRRAGLPGAIWCASPFPLAALSFCFARPLPGWGCPFLGPLLALSLFPCPPPPFFFLSSGGPSCLLPSLVSGPGCLGPWRFVFLSSPPPRPVVFFFCVPPLSLVFSGFRPRVPWALALCAVCFVGLPLLGSPCSLASFVFPARLLAAPWWLLPPPPPRLSCLAVSLAASRCSVFFFIVRPRCLWLSLISSPGALGLGAVGCLFCWPPVSLLSVRSRLVSVSRLAVGCSLVVAAPHPHPFLSRCFRCSVLRFLFFFLALSIRAPVVSAPAVSGFLWFPAPGALGLGTVCCLFWWPPASRLAVRSRLLCVSRLAAGCSLVVAAPPPPLCLAVFVAAPRSWVFLLFLLCAAVVSGFLWFPAPGAPCLGAVCCFFCMPPVSRLAVRSRLFCVSCLAVGCSVVFAAPPPFCVSRFSSMPLGARYFFSCCAPPLSLALSGFRPPVPWALALCVVCFRRGWLWCPVFCFVRRSVVWCCGPWCVLCCAWCCVVCLCLVGFFRRVVVGLVVLFLLCFAVVCCCVLCLFFFLWSLAFPWCSGLFQFQCSASAVPCQCAWGVVLCALLSCPCGAGWCFVLLSVVLACLL